MAYKTRNFCLIDALHAKALGVHNKFSVSLTFQLFQFSPHEIWQMLEYLGEPSPFPAPQIHLICIVLVFSFGAKVTVNFRWIDHFTFSPQSIPPRIFSVPSTPQKCISFEDRFISCTHRNRDDTSKTFSKLGKHFFCLRGFFEGRNFYGNLFMRNQIKFIQGLLQFCILLCIHGAYPFKLHSNYFS